MGAVSRAAWLEAASSLLLASAKGALAGAKLLWKRLPGGVRQWASPGSRWPSLGHVLHYLATYDETHHAENFAGNLAVLHQRYPGASAAGKERLAKQFHKIMDGLVMPNGVQKTTSPMRQHDLLAKVLADEQSRPRKSAITVLDLPSSAGVAALDSIELLRRHYTIKAYVLADLCFHLHYDPARGCVFDEDLNLLQVRFSKRFFSIHRGHSSGDVYSPLTAALLYPLDAIAWCLKRKYAYSTDRRADLLSLLHPEVDSRVSRGDFSLSRTDVFQRVEGRYDLILCFNFLQRNYFPPVQIARGVANLADALDDQGFLIMGNDRSYSVAQRRAGKLVTVQEGRLGD